jgi:antitoxin component of MazEF toxin-antitoxin module
MEPRRIYRGDGAMIKRLTKHGNSLALVIDKPVLDLLKIDADTPLGITTDGRTLVISPTNDPARTDTFRSALETVNRQHGGALKKLAE